MGLTNVPREWNYPMCPGNETSQCSLGMGLAYELYELDYPMSPGMGLANVPWEWDYPMCPWNGTIQSALGMRVSNVPWEWD